MTMRQNKWTLGTYYEAYYRVVTSHHTLEDTSVFPHLRVTTHDWPPSSTGSRTNMSLSTTCSRGGDRPLVAFVAVPDGMAELRLAVALLSDPAVPPRS